MIKSGAYLIAALLLGTGAGLAQERPLPETAPQPAQTTSPEPGSAPPSRTPAVRTDSQAEAMRPATAPADPVTDEVGHVLEPDTQATGSARPDGATGPEPELRGRN